MRAGRLTITLKQRLLFEASDIEFYKLSAFSGDVHRKKS